MALLSELVAVCEQHQLDGKATLNVFARRLREAGRISQAGRGRGAAHMTALDAARFLIACAATDQPERAVEAESVFSNLKCGHELMREENALIASKDVPTLDLALARAIHLLGTGEIDAADKAEHERRFPGIPRITSSETFAVWLIVRRSSVGANIRVLGTELIYQHPILSDLVASVNRFEPFDNQLALSERLDRETHQFRTGKNLSAELKYPLLQAVGRLIVGGRRLD
ncbi:hypothetical protein [Rhizobium sp. FKY42]|uniref:hypothetical protein n=1 Tax=Rhizobium sp. FKY42 TaxID=2562310 RepID=UPI0010C060AE|nr:hypothetical protein [Rhizobium sp. FKY42]